MKKLTLPLVLAMTFSLAACNKADSNKADSNNAAEAAKTKTDNMAVAVAEPAKDTDPMVGCYTLAKGNFDIEVKKADGKYTADFSKQGGEKKSVTLEALAGEGLTGIIPAAERDQVETALAAMAEDVFLIAKYKAGTKPESDYMAVASMELGGGPAMKVACK